MLCAVSVQKTRTMCSGSLARLLPFLAWPAAETTIAAELAEALAIFNQVKGQQGLSPQQLKLLKPLKQIPLALHQPAQKESEPSTCMDNTKARMWSCLRKLARRNNSRNIDYF